MDDQTRRRLSEAWDGARRCNMPAVSGELLAAIGMHNAAREDRIVWPLLGHDLREVAIDYSGNVTEHDVKPVTQAVLSGLLSPVIERVNMVNAAIVAEERGIKVTESVSRRARDFREHDPRACGHRRAKRAKWRARCSVAVTCE